MSTLDLPADLLNFDPSTFENLLSTSNKTQMEVEDENVETWLGSVYENNQSTSSITCNTSTAQTNSSNKMMFNHELNGNSSGLIRDPMMSFNSDIDLS